MTAKKPNKNCASPRAERPAEGVYFLSLSLENVRCFGPKQTLDLSDGKGRPARWTILLGNNGTGKTTVLQALVGFESFRLNGRANLRIEQWMMEDDLASWFRVEENLAEICARIGSGRTEEKAAAAISYVDSHLRFRRDSVLGAPQLGFEFAPFPKPIFCMAYGTTRRMASSSLNDTAAHTGASATLFSDQAELRNAEEWLLQLDYAATKHPDKSEQRHRFNQVKELLLKIMLEGEVQDIRCVAGTGTHPQSKVECQTPYGWVPLRQLGYGYQTLIAWMVDFASRMVERYPNSADPLAEPAVVLVDEIDLHLHPTWQRKLIGFLTERFPNTQFIATAHSPLVVQAAEGANFAVLRREGDHVVIDQSFQGIHNWRIDQVLTSQLFGLESARPPELDRLLSRRTKLLEKGKLTSADKAELKELEKRIGELPAGETAKQTQEILDLTRKTQELLETYHAKRP